MFFFFFFFFFGLSSSLVRAIGWQNFVQFYYPCGVHCRRHCRTTLFETCSEKNITHNTSIIHSITQASWACCCFVLCIGHVLNNVLKSFALKKKRKCLYILQKLISYVNFLFYFYFFNFQMFSQTLKTKLSRDPWLFFSLTSPWSLIDGRCLMLYALHW